MIYQFKDHNVQKAILANQWAYGQLFPEIISPGPLPLKSGYKTHTFSSKFTDTVNVWDINSYNPDTQTFEEYPERKGKLWVYFAPMNDLLSLSVNLPIGTDVDVLNDNSIFYSSSNGPVPYSNMSAFDYRELTLNGSSKKNISFLGYKKLRVTSAAIVIKQIGPVKERSGILKIGLGYKGAIESVPSINFDKFQNYFNISDIVQLNTSDEIICRYRLPKHLLHTYAPFDPSTSLPYFFIYGEGISQKMSLHIEVIRHFEGIILPEFSNFHNPGSQPRQTSFIIQDEVVSLLERDNNIIQNIEETDDKMNPRLNNGHGSKSILSEKHGHEPLEPLKMGNDMSMYEKALKSVGQSISAVGERVSSKMPDFKERIVETRDRITGRIIDKAIDAGIKKGFETRVGSSIKNILGRVYNTGASLGQNIENMASNFVNNTLDMAERATERLIS